MISSPQNISHVLLYVKDVSASLNFYRDSLGFQGAMLEGCVVAQLDVGGSAVILHTDKNLDPGYLPAPGQRGRGVIVEFEVPDVDAYCQSLKSKGVKISMEPVSQPWGLRQMYLYDPDGYNLAFSQRVASGGK